ncbi:MAG TPA: hypothetical protein VE243_06245, partial [Candidatus Acidoferrum sp.]|nr:hypothetical protein [Candidatus Acidoferrum sp.]
MEVVHSVRIARRVCERQAEKFILRSSLFCHSRVAAARRIPVCQSSLSVENRASKTGSRIACPEAMLITS